MWWLVGALALAAVVAIALALRRRSRRRAWAAEFLTTSRDVADFARGTVNQLEQAPTAQQMAGGWRIEAGRVAGVEDELTRLEATAVTADDRSRARTLRDAVRAARSQLAALDETVDVVVALGLLRAVAAGLEDALAAVRAPAEPSTVSAPPP